MQTVDVMFDHYEMASSQSIHIHSEISVCGLRVTPYGLAKHGYNLRVTKKWDRSRFTKFTFSDGSNHITLRVKHVPPTKDFDTLLEYLTTSYRRDRQDEIGVSTRGERPVNVSYHDLTRFSEAELLAELERRVDEKPKRRKRTPLPPANVINLAEVMARLERNEDILPRKVA